MTAPTITHHHHHDHATTIRSTGGPSCASAASASAPSCSAHAGIATSSDRHDGSSSTHRDVDATATTPPTRWPASTSSRPRFACSPAATSGSWRSNGMPSHNMMVGITSWQQQVPVPQPYTGANAWQIPAAPTLAATPISAKTALYRGAIALAVNGVPIFNALNNRGDDAYLAGELDEWGGHAGRADDYHYHVAPLHLQSMRRRRQTHRLRPRRLPDLRHHRTRRIRGHRPRRVQRAPRRRRAATTTTAPPPTPTSTAGSAASCTWSATRSTLNRSPSRSAPTAHRCGAPPSPRFETTGAERLPPRVLPRRPAPASSNTPSATRTVSFVFTDPTGPVRTETYTRRSS